jgi:hypothetical protein
VCRRLRHAPAAARGAEAAPLAREGDEAVAAASIAVQSQKAMSQHTAAEVGPQLLLDESGCGLARFPRASEERLELFANDAVEEGLLGGSGRVTGSRCVSSRPKNGVLGSALRVRVRKSPREIARASHPKRGARFMPVCGRTSGPRMPPRAPAFTPSAPTRVLERAPRCGGFLRAPIGTDSLPDIILYLAWELLSFYRLSSF